MDIVGLVKKSYSDYGTIIADSWYTYICEELRENVSITIHISHFARFLCSAKSMVSEK